MTQNPQGDPVYPSYQSPTTDSPWGTQSPAGTTPPPMTYQAPAGQTAFERTVGSIGGTEPMTPAQERNWGMLAHLIPAALFVLSAGTLGFFASLGIYFMYKDRGPFVRQNAANSLNVQITAGIGLLISLPLMFLLIGFVTYPLICIWALIVHLIAASKASNGEWYNPPFAIKFIK
ncbi:MAG TPA: DUF4870 domain-containing protein [Tetrasphaera sp.]|uniref:DUF4870 domain-containing protein n=1 Tax=Nostocoides sp. TaxID=1917966 RepID=UPI002C22BFEB|nr:DUF4870 domain-containing protein [Tetrasphaera sp.]HNQ07491.1 DUF4870 domain-containing protein [Tetrasphaera sp.]